MDKRLLLLFFLINGATLVARQTDWRDLIDKRKFEEAISQVGNLQASDSADFTKMYLIGQAYEGLLKYNKAYQYYRHCYTLDSTRTDMLNTLARISVNLGKVQEANHYYQQTLRYDSVNFYANYQLARLYVSLEKYSDALKHYDLLLEKDPENAVILRAMGDCYIRMDFMQSAAECYAKAYWNNVENASLASVYINTLLNLHLPPFFDNTDSAMFVCDTALFYNPENKILRQKKAMIYYLKRNYVSADSVYSSLLADNDSSYVTLKYCGCSRYYARKWYDAVEPLEKAFALDSTAYDVCLLLGISIGRTYDPKQAILYFDKAEELMAPDPFWNDALTQFRAEIYLKTDECEKGSKLYYRLWEKDKKQFSWLSEMRICYDRRKRQSEMSDEDRQQLLYIDYLYISEALKNPKNETVKNMYSYMRSILERYQEEMFFKGVNSLPMITPDNKKMLFSEEKLKEMLAYLSEK
ncbi:MAG: tetratricopeptide repeat protein [Tannerella sp.]|jgi:tetratricopeptide (TPR) repeat protein|nr:tetratricopeptide repeat protein [Tannerella sp.]